MKLLALTLATLLPLPLRAQAWAVHPALQAGLAATDNANHAAGEGARADVIASVQPGVELAARLPALRLDALLSADLDTHLNHTQPSRAFPRVSAAVAATLLPRALFLDAALSVQAAESDPYGARSETGGADNRSTRTAWRVGPRLERELWPATRLLARYEEAGVRPGGAVLADQRTSTFELRIERRPRPLGGSLAFSAQRLSFGSGDGGSGSGSSGSAGSAGSRSTLQSASARGDLALAGGELVIGPLAGRERTRLLLDESRSTLYGAHLAWTPDERIRLAAEVSHRFFGTGWRLDVHYRRPLVSFTLEGRRELLTAATSLGVVGAGTRLDTLLDAALATRVPDAAARKALVDELLAARGLPAAPQGPVDVQAAYAQRADSLRAGVLLAGRRTLVSFSAYALGLRQLAPAAGDIAALAALPPATLDNRQAGATLNVNHRLTPLVTLDVEARGSSVHALGSGPPGATRERTLRASAQRTLAPRTALSFGLQWQRLRSTREADVHATAHASWRAATAFAGLRHRF